VGPQFWPSGNLGPQGVEYTGRKKSRHPEQRSSFAFAMGGNPGRRNRVRLLCVPSPSSRSDIGRREIGGHGGGQGEYSEVFKNRPPNQSKEQSAANAVLGWRCEYIDKKEQLS